jgi:hypothetical protein
VRDWALYASGIIGLTAAFLHGLLGETRVFARVRIEPDRFRLLMRLVWHCSVVAWAAVAVLLIANAWATRGRFFGWIILTAVVVLALAGL